MKGYQEAVDIFNKRDKVDNLTNYLQNMTTGTGPGQHLSKHIDADAIDLIHKMLEYDPRKRITSLQALQHPFFKKDPKPCQPNEIPQIEGELKELNFREERN